MTRRTTSSPEFWLHTDRLMLRRFTPADRPWLHELYADADVMRYLGGAKTAAQTDAIFDERILGYYDLHPGLGIWMTVERSTGDCLGFHLLNNVQGETFIQVGFVLAKAAWGRGIGTEMAAAVLRYGFVDLRLPRIVAIASLPNLASQRVLEKIGLRRHGVRAFPHRAYSAEGPMAWFERDGPDWLAERMLPPH